MNATVVPLAPGDAGIAQTIRAMRRLIDQGKKDPAIHELAARIVRARGVRAFDWMGEVRAIYDWVLANIRFTRDVYGKETLHAAPEILRLGIGDCDDFTILICALLGTVGHRTRIVTVSSLRADPKQFSHAYPEVSVGGQWIPVDAARMRPAFGTSAQDPVRKRVWSTESDEFIDVSAHVATANDVCREFVDDGILRAFINQAAHLRDGHFGARIADGNGHRLRRHRDKRGSWRCGRFEIHHCAVSGRRGCVGRKDLSVTATPNGRAPAKSSRSVTGTHPNVKNGKQILVTRRKTSLVQAKISPYIG